ncbi:MAG: transposase [Planctomycetota bacterium]|jgi:putative transposase
MPRLARAVAVGFAHHITQRGNNRQDVFFVDDDRRVYLKLLKEQADKYALELIGYCLMSNHVHIIAIPKAEDSLARAIGRTHFRYTQYINRFHRRSGHLWQGRFYSCALDERHFWLAMRYIELNPVRARLCRKPWRYEWSSAAAHVDAKARSELLDLSRWYDMTSAAQWRTRLAEGVSDSDLGRLRSSTHTERPLGSDSFLSRLERLLGRRVCPLPVGRPKKDKGIKKTKKV